MSKKLSPLKAIRAKCLDCCAKNSAEVKRCEIEDCPLWQFRFGKNPNRAGIGRKDAFISSKTSRELGKNFGKRKVDRLDTRTIEKRFSHV